MSKKLHEIPQGSKIMCECSDGSSYIIFNKIDGMYSHCTTEKGGVMNLDASMLLKKVGDHYEIEEENDN